MNTFFSPSPDSAQAAAAAAQSAMLERGPAVVDEGSTAVVAGFFR